MSLINNEKKFLYYRGTDTAIKLGDRILWCSFFKKKPGTVVYMPGQSLVNTALESEGFLNWAVQLDSQPHDLITMLYWPEGGEVVPKKVKFLGRGEAINQVLESNEVL